MVQAFGWVVRLCAFACLSAIQGSAVSGTNFRPQVIFPRLGSAPSPERSSSPLLFPPKNSGVASSSWKPWDPPLAVQSPAPDASLASGLKPNEQPKPSHWKKAPVDNVPLHATSPEPNTAHILPPAPSTSYVTAATPVPGLPHQNTHHYATVRHSPTEAPTLSKPHWHFSGAPAPQWFSKSIPGLRSSSQHHHAKNSGSPLSASPIPSSSNHYSPIPSTGQAKTPQISKRPLPPQFQVLPPPPPQKDCAPLACTEPLTYGPPEWPCVCVLPIQVGLRLTVALYTFFPLVSVLASEIAAGVFMKQSQVRIMGANAAGDNPEETIVLIDLLPLEERFDDTTAYITFKRFWSKQVAIQPSFFGDFDVLYVRYPGLPPSPPLLPLASGIIPSKPYPGRDSNGRAMKPLGVDISKTRHKHWLSRSTVSIIILSCTVALLLICGVLWVLVFRHGQCVSRSDPDPSTTIRSLPKSSGNMNSVKAFAKRNEQYGGLPLSMVGSGANSPSFSLGSSIAAYTGSAKTFSSSDIERATNFFNEIRILGEGGFGRVYSGVLDDGTKVAIKILKRYDQQGSREFLAEVEMLSRLHHRNLVKLIGICVEDRTRCLVYELVPNGSVESHLHGFDKEKSPLDWSSRLKIALGAARALAYLHEDSSPRVIHRDFKASNILLEDDFTPKVSDFGLARAAFDEANRHISTRVMGTFGYVAPEYAMTGHLLVKSDVYSYGVVLLELLTGRKPVDMSQPPGQENLVSWARPLLTTREGLDSMMDPSLGPDFPRDSISKVAAIASMCVQPEVSNRPFMGEVVQALKMVCNEHDGTNYSPSGSCISHEDLSMVMDDGDITNSGRLAAALITPCSAPCYNYHRDLSMSSELLGSSKIGAQDSESFRRHSSSEPLRTGKGKVLWGSTRKIYRGSVSEHRLLFKFWPGSH